MQTASKESFLIAAKHWETNFITHRKHHITYVYYLLGLALEVSKYIWNDLQEMYEYMPV